MKKIFCLLTFLSLSAHAGKSNLTQKEAEERKSMVKNIHYELRVDITSPDFFTGELTTKFNLSRVASIPLDFEDGTIEFMKVNGVQLVTPLKNGKLTLTANILKKDQNEILIKYKSPYSKNGMGLYRFVDPEDKRVYLYTQFEPMDAHRLFPCFDQPDLKASLKMTVVAPKSWIVVSADMEELTRESDQVREWVFPWTPNLSTYLYSLHAGEYKIWKSKAGTIPLRLMARHSLAKYVDPDYWFELTRAGFEFFPKYFDNPYPFQKYDQVIVPDFNSGAMENVGAVTFSERYISRSEPTADQKERLANTLLHEMAHMWFGNLVTMKWWDGLWLNESFANYMAYFALHEATEFKRSWLSFFLYTKSWAYQKDQLVTTHPIDGPVKDVHTAMTNFDGITYGKGASVLKQLVHYIGKDNFQNGVQAYFKKFPYQNTSLRDFMGSLEELSKRDLKQWSNVWLRKSGLDEVRTQWSCKDDKLQSLSLSVRSPDRRPHRMTVGLVNREGEVLKVTKRLDAEVTTKTDVPIPEDTLCPQLVFPNTDDHAYVKTVLDDKSLEVAKKELWKIEDPLLRVSLWHTLYEMVRDQKFPLPEYLALYMEHLTPETDAKVLQFAIQTGHLYSLWRPDIPSEASQRHYWAEKREALLWSALQKTKGDDQKRWFEAWATSAETPPTLAKVKDLLIGRSSISGLPLDPDRRWMLMSSLARWNVDGWKDLLSAEKKSDPSQRGKQAALEIETYPAVESLKAEAWTEIVSFGDQSLSLVQKQARARGLFVGDQFRLKESFGKRFFETLKAKANQIEPQLAWTLVNYAAPAVCSDASIKVLSEFIKQSGDKLPFYVKRPLLEVQQENERCVKIKALAARSTGLAKH